MRTAKNCCRGADLSGLRCKKTVVWAGELFRAYFRKNIRITAGLIKEVAEKNTALENLVGSLQNWDALTQELDTFIQKRDTLIQDRDDLADQATI